MSIFDLIGESVGLVSPKSGNRRLDLAKPRQHLSVPLTSSGLFSLNLLQVFENKIVSLFNHAKILTCLHE